MDEMILEGKTLLVVDDESDLRDIIASELEFLGARVFQAENIQKARTVLEAHQIDLIISDIRMPGGTGIDLLDSVKARNASAPVILITGFADITTEDAFDRGAEALINKPFKLDDLIRMIVKYTSPLGSRFQEMLPAKKMIEASSEDVKLGRGGLALKVETSAKRIDVGEAVDFHFAYDNREFRGQGVCRWLRIPDFQQTKAIVGLEFVNLDDASLAYLDKFVHSRNIVPFIPSARA